MEHSSRNRGIVFILILALVALMMPSTAFAAEGDKTPEVTSVTIGGISITDEDETVKIPASGNIEVTFDDPVTLGDSADGSVTLTLSGNDKSFSATTATSNDEGKTLSWNYSDLTPGTVYGLSIAGFVSSENSNDTGEGEDIYKPMVVYDNNVVISVLNPSITSVQASTPNMGEEGGEQTITVNTSDLTSEIVNLAAFSGTEVDSNVNIAPVSTSGNARTFTATFPANKTSVVKTYNL